MTETKNIQQTREEKEKAKVTFAPVPAMKIVQINENPKKGCTTVMFADNKRVTVKVGKDEQHPDLYSAVAAAMAIRAYGSNSAFKRAIKEKLTHKKPQKSSKKDHIIETGDIVRITRRGRDVYSSPSLCGYSDIEVDREMVVAKVEKVEAISLDRLEKIESTMAYVNTPDKIADVQYKIPVGKLYIVRKHEAAD